MNRREFFKRTVAATATLWFGVGKAEDKLSPLNDALRRVYFVESSNGTNPKAFKPNHVGALGPLQITEIVVKDVNRILRLPVFGLNDRLDLKASIEMFKIYCNHYYPNGTVEQLCRLWYQGPSRKRQYNADGDKYWSMCQQNSNKWLTLNVDMI